MHCHNCSYSFEAPPGAFEVKCPHCGARVTLTAQKTRATPGGSPARPGGDPRIGGVLGGYRLTSVLGGGGMGLVYDAERVDGDGPPRAAIKVLSPAFAEDPDFVARFRREADALIRLRHDNLIEVYEKGEHTPDDGGPPAYFFVMERFDGVDLRRYVGARAAEPLSVATVLAIVRQAAEGLAYAHDNGVVHRDIKPGNILVRGDPATDGLVKVVDFGVAQLASPNQTLTNLTRSDLILGTYNYMSPEQRVDASRIDRRADVYALGVVAYELLTGSLPLGAFEAPSELRQGLPKATDRAVLAALRRDPAQRPDGVEHFARALELAVRPPRTGRWLAAGALAVMLGGGGFALTQWPDSPPSKIAAEAKVEPKQAKAEPPPQTKAELTKAAPQPAQAPTPAPRTMSDEQVSSLSTILQKDARLARKQSARLTPKPKSTRPSKKRKVASPKALKGLSTGTE